MGDVFEGGEVGGSVIGADAAFVIAATSAFMRMKLGQAFTRRNIAPHVFEKKEDAQAFLASLDAQKREAS